VSALGRVLRRLLPARFGSPRPLDPAPGYDLWAPTYDDTDNLLVTLDELVFGSLIAELTISEKRILDVGCGTGRHWAKLLAQRPAALLGVDASQGMLDRLRQKYPQADLRRTDSHLLPGTHDGSFDLVVCTLALAHLPDADAAFAEWSRVLCSDGHAIVTDLHPEAVQRGACTFEHQNRTLEIRLYPRSLASIEGAARKRGLETVKLEQRVIDEAVRPYFEGRGAIAMFDRLAGLPLIYGLHLRKRA
jgi:ubiquinone/menaquinone biosynthesis C-methylase UbiE